MEPKSKIIKVGSQEYVPENIPVKAGEVCVLKPKSVGMSTGFVRIEIPNKIGERGGVPVYDSDSIKIHHKPVTLRRADPIPDYASEDAEIIQNLTNRRKKKK